MRDRRWRDQRPRCCLSVFAASWTRVFGLDPRKPSNLRRGSQAKRVSGGRKEACRAPGIGNLSGSLSPQFYRAVLRFDWTARTEIELSGMGWTRTGHEVGADAIRLRRLGPGRIWTLVRRKIRPAEGIVVDRSGGQGDAWRACLGKRAQRTPPVVFRQSRGRSQIRAPEI